MRSTILESYLQDSWRVNRKLTVDYGLRLGAYTPLWTPNLKASSFDPSSYQRSQAPILFQPALNPQRERSARNPVTGEFSAAVLIRLLVPNSGSLTHVMLIEQPP